MPSGRTTSARAGSRPPILAVLALAVAAVAGVAGHQSLAASSSAALPYDPQVAEAPAAAGPAPGPGSMVEPPRQAEDRRGGAAVPSDGRGPDDGAVPDRASVFDADLPAVERLDAALLAAVRRAANEAAADGVRLELNSGWRSAEYQERLLDEAVAKYGSRREAARWVARPETSAHVAGAAIDVGPAKAIAWLAEHGEEFGLCQIYRNEPWHFELRPDAPTRGCPSTYADPSQDPRMR